MFMSQTVSMMVQFHGDVFHFLFCHQIQGEKEKKRALRGKKENVPCSFLYWY